MDSPKLQQDPRLTKEVHLEEMAQQIHFAKIGRGLVRRIPLMLFFSLLLSLVVFLLVQQRGSRFISSSYLIYQTEAPRFLPGKYPLTHYSKSSAMEMVKLPSHLYAVKSILGLDIPDVVLDSMIEVTSPASDSNLIQILVTADHPSLAIDITNTLAKVVAQKAKEFTQKELRNALKYFNERTDELKIRLEKKIHEMSVFQKERRLLEVNKEGFLVIKSLTNLEQRYQLAKERYYTFLIQYEDLKKASAKMPDQVIKLSVDDNPLRRQLAQLELTLIETRARYAPENPKIKELESKIDEIRKQLQQSKKDPRADSQMYHEYESNSVKDKIVADLLTLSGELRSAQKIKEDLEKELTFLASKLEELPEDQATFSTLQQEKLSLEEDLKESESVLKSAKAFLQIGKSGIEVYLNAAETQKKNSIFMNLLPILGFFFGGLLSVSIGVYLELSDKYFRTKIELEKHYNIPCITEIPEMMLMGKVIAGEKFLYFLRLLQDSLEKKRNHLATTLTFLSSITGEGKSTLIYFWARYLAETNRKVLILQFEQQVPSPYTPDTKPLLLRYLLSSMEKFDELAIKRDGIYWLTVKKTRHMKEQWQMPQIKELIQELRRHFFFVFIDAPSILEEDYACSLAGMSDETLFVVGSSKVKKKYIEKAIQEIEFQQIIPYAMLLNRCISSYLDDVRIKEQRKTSLSILKRFFKAVYTHES